MENLPMLFKMCVSLLFFLLYILGCGLYVGTRTLELDHETSKMYHREPRALDYRMSLIWPLLLLGEIFIGIYECLKEASRVIWIIIRGDR